MLKIQNYVRPQTLEEAYELCQKKNNVVLGGMLWLKMQKRSVQTAIDLCDLGLGTVEETDEEYRIGAMVSLRDLELHQGLNELTHGAMARCVEHIVGVQFRNVATIGGSIFGRFGFSDVLTLFMAIGAKVELFGRGVMTVEEFAQLPMTARDILVRIIVPKTARQVVYLSQRNISTDFPVLTCALSREGDILSCAIGARPGKAICLHAVPGGEPEETADYVAQRVTFGGNMRGSAEYRERICRVLVRRALAAMNEQEV